MYKILIVTNMAEGVATSVASFDCKSLAEEAIKIAAFIPNTTAYRLYKED